MGKQLLKLESERLFPLTDEKRREKILSKLVAFKIILIVPTEI
jgi:hypothetical protein